MNVSAHIIVIGLVQGVGFRYFVYTKAKQLELKGFVRNLFNGNVEVAVEGDRATVESLIEQLRIGPRMSHVKDIQIEWVENRSQYSTFEIR